MFPIAGRQHFEGQFFSGLAEAAALQAVSKIDT
jgi:hypothetical protein